MTETATQPAPAATKPTVFEAMAAVMEDVQAVGKKDRNTQQGYVFRGIDAVINAVGPAFRKHGIVPVPLKTDAKYRDVQTSTGKPSRECTVTVTYRFYGPAGDSIDCEVPGESMDFGDKGAPKAMSVAYRIALLQVLAIPTDEPEVDSFSYERAQHERPVQNTGDGWVQNIRARMEAATTADELDTLGKELRARGAACATVPDDYDVVWEFGKARYLELNGTSA